MPTRRTFLKSGLSAAALGLMVRPGSLARAFGAQLGALGRRSPEIGPILELPQRSDLVMLEGLPFAPWFTGDDYPNDAIPYHALSYHLEGDPPPPEETVDIAIVGGGLSGLSTAYHLRQHRPVLFELRRRFGGNAQGELWGETQYSLGTAYFMTPDEGSSLESLYSELGFDQRYKFSGPPDPVELRGAIYDDFWEGVRVPQDQRPAFERYADVVRYFADVAYPDIPLVGEPEPDNAVRELDRRSFRDDLNDRMGMPLPPLLAAAIQGYFYSSFGAGMDEISAAGGWNFVAAEEYGRWVLPGGGSGVVDAFWQALLREGFERRSGESPRLRAGCGVIDVRLRGALVQVSWVDPRGRTRSLLARRVVMAGSKHVAKHVLHNLSEWDEARRDAMDRIQTMGYVVANVLLDAPIERPFYDVFLLHDEKFPMDPVQLERHSQVTDMLNGHYARRSNPPRSVLTLYWPLAFAPGRFTLMRKTAYEDYARQLAPQLRAMLEMLHLPESAVEQVRMTRWAHAFPISRPNLIAGGFCETLRSPLSERIFFVNQDNWALPAVETCLLEAEAMAPLIAEGL